MPDEQTEVEEVEEDDAEIDPYEIELAECEVMFITKVSGVANLGEAAEVAALNIIRNGLDSYYILYTNDETGEQYLSEAGRFAEVPDHDRDDAGADA